MSFLGNADINSHLRPLLDKKHNELDSDPAKVPKESFLMVKLLI